MKKVLLVAAIAAFAMSSCKKDYTCECTSKDSNGTVISTADGTVHTTKSKAKDACSQTASASSGGTSITTTCALK
jgi:hypothetical protein